MAGSQGNDGNAMTTDCVVTRGDRPVLGNQGL